MRTGSDLCLAGYIASWEIRDDELLLLDVLSPLTLKKSTGTFSELFDKKGRPRPLCPYCRKPFSTGKLGRLCYAALHFCPHCGSVQHSMTCPECGIKCDLVALFCPRCGRSLGKWQCGNCKGMPVDWMTARPPLPPPGAFCIRCRKKTAAGEVKDLEIKIPWKEQAELDRLSDSLRKAGLK